MFGLFASLAYLLLQPPGTLFISLAGSLLRRIEQGMPLGLDLAVSSRSPGKRSLCLLWPSFPRTRLDWLRALQSQKVETVFWSTSPSHLTGQVGGDFWVRHALSYLCLRLQSSVPEGPSHPHCGTSPEALLSLKQRRESRAPKLAAPFLGWC